MTILATNDKFESIGQFGAKCEYFKLNMTIWAKYDTLEVKW